MFEFTIDLFKIKLIIFHTMSTSKHEPVTLRNPSLGTYSKYKCQYKHKPILTKLSNDAGYPQQILNPSEPASPDCKNNYL